jgi:hypothetical protein
MIHPIPIDRLPSDLRDAFDRLVADAAGDFRPTPLARLVTIYIALFAGLRRLGASWVQIAALLAAHGVGCNDGQITADVLRATYARAAKVAKAVKSERTQRNAPKHDETGRKATTRVKTRRSAAERNGMKPDSTADEALIRRASLTNKPWHMR